MAASKFNLTPDEIAAALREGTDFQHTPFDWLEPRYQTARYDPVTNFHDFGLKMLASLPAVMTESYERVGIMIKEAQRNEALAQHIDAIWRLLEITESLAPPDLVDPGTFEDREFVSPDGWRVTIFYDGGELDYISHFTTPKGEMINFWKWPEETPGRDLLMNWRKVGDRKRLMEFAAAEAATIKDTSDGS